MRKNPIIYINKDIRVSELKPCATNPRRKVEEAAEAVAESMRNFGVSSPIIVEDKGPDGMYEIVNGHARRLAALKLGNQTIACRIIKNATPEEIRALRIIDNRSAEFAEWDSESLLKQIEQLKSLDDLDIDLDKYKFDELLAALQAEELKVDFDDGAAAAKGDAPAQKALKAVIKIPPRLWLTQAAEVSASLNDAAKEWGMEIEWPD